MKRSTLAARLIQATNNSQRKTLLAANRALADDLLARTLKDECYRIWSSRPTDARKVAAALDTLASFSPSKEIAAIRFWVSGIADITRGKLELAIANLDSASNLLARLGRKHESAQPQVAKLIALAMLGRYDEAQTTGRKALKIFEKFDDQLAAGKIEMNLSNVVSRRDQYRLAERYCMSAYKRFEKLGETEWQTMAENGLANTYAELNDFNRAEMFYGRALKRARAARMDLTVAEIEASIGNLALFRGRYAEALRQLESSRRMYEKLGMPHQTAIAELEIADIYAELNLNTEAMDLYRSLLPTLRALKMRAEEARAHLNLGRTFSADREYGDAQRELKRSAALYKAERNSIAAAAVDLRRASLEAARGNYRSALESVDKVVAVLESSENVRLILSAMWLRGDLLAKLGNHDGAEKLLERTLRKARSSDQRAVAQAAMNSLGELALRKNKFGRAEKFFSSAITDAEASRAPLPGEQFRMAFLAKALEPYGNLARLYIAKGKIDQAFVCVERARSRSLLEGVASSGSQGAYDDTKVREELNRYYSRLDRADEEHEGRKLRSEIQKREKQLATSALRRQSIETKTVKQSGRAELDLGRLKKKLGSKKAVVEFVVDEGTYFAFVVTNDAVEYVGPLTAEAEILQLLVGLHFQFGSLRFGGTALTAFATQLKARADQYLERLYAKLLSPLEGYIAGRDLVIVPAGALHYVPFHALFDGKKYAIESREITYSPSASVWLLLNSRRPRKFENALLMAYADDKIPHVDKEVKVLARKIPKAHVLTGRRASFSAFERDSPNFDLIHLACHGQFRPDNPMFSSLHLADGWVTVRDVCARDLKAELVTLSACETGLSEVFPGEEILGLARGFLSAGAGSLVLSLWTVNDEATTALMADFYSNLQRGSSVSASLKIAQTNFIDRGEHPYYWSPFFVIA